MSSDAPVDGGVVCENEVEAEIGDESDAGETESDSDADLDDFVADSPTLTRLEEDDVALEMDEWALDDGSEEEGELGDEWT